ncbi:MAG: transposase, partial [Prolixibacteraceae bacterium]|nr:transposase [Prolixibacteraceae bacterium]
MSLFQKSVEKKYLNDLDPALIDKKYADFQNYFGNPERQENIRNSKEEQFQEGFLRELFVNILGYTLNPEPDFNLTTELKNISNSKKADGAILKKHILAAEAEEHAPLPLLHAHAVIELKSTNTTDLDSIETQAFGYKNHHPKCVYVITSNFEKLRFYIQNAVDHIDFDLFKLTKEQFSLLWLCLAKDNLLNDLPLKIKDSSVLQEENITKKLYADYSTFRVAIYNNLIKNNPDKDKLLLFKKTQKLLDRFLFIFFAEDRLLVPPNSISRIIEKWKDDVDFGDARPLYHTFQRYFHVLNVGRPKSGNRQEIFAYNGGLFKPDKILDNITIDDNILYEHTLRLSNYNFETDVDVNILGHIFEHSLGEIENVQAEIKGENVDNQKTKRKKDGIFYTPKYITKYIVENTLGKLCLEKRAELNIVDEEYAKGRRNRKTDIVKTLDKKLDKYRNWLLTLTILDPACGSGAFLNQALEFLITEHRKIDELRAQLFGGAIVFSNITTNILEKNIFGVDINEESVDIAKLSLWLRTAQKGRKLNTLSNNIKCGNSLIDDPKVAGEKAFNWQKEFPDIFQKKEKKAWHITTATHNSRYSQRMFDNYVKLGEPVWLNEKEENIVSETIAEIVEKDKLNIISYNICGDHMHMLLVCEEEELPKIVQKIKSMSARACNIAMGRTVPKAEKGEHAPHAGYDTSAEQTSEHAPRLARGKTQNHLWTQKFGQKEITSEGQLRNTIEYIRNNRIKHGMDESSHSNIGACSDAAVEHAFRTEYTGGFDVVIGNPPYVRAELLTHFREYLENNYSVYNSSGDLFSYFYEKSFKLLKAKTGLFGFISNTFDKTTAGISIREYLQNEIL